MIENKNFDAFVLNTTDPEPLMYSESTGALIWGKSLCETLRSLKKSYNIDNLFVVVYENKFKLIKHLEKNCNSDIKIIKTPERYVASHTKFLEVLLKTRYTISNPVFLSVSDLKKIELSFKSKEANSTLVTVHGEVKNPKVLKVQFGTPFIELVRFVGTDLEDYELIENGPISGKIVKGDAIVTKDTKALLVLKTSNPLVRLKKRTYKKAIKLSQACHNCGLCTSRCPAHMLHPEVDPQKLSQRLAYYAPDKVSISGALECIQCGLCEMLCPLSLSPNRIYAELYTKLKGSKINNDIKEEFYFHSLIPLSKLIENLGLIKHDIEPDFDILSTTNKAA